MVIDKIKNEFNILYAILYNGNLYENVQVVLVTDRHCFVFLHNLFNSKILNFSIKFLFH